jgi:serine/threonine protein kinase
MQGETRYQKGDTIGGRFLVHRALKGGMGEVYLCFDRDTRAPIALKTFQARFLADPRLRNAFTREVTTWISLEKHPNIVHCQGMDVINGTPFMILEWVTGEPGCPADLRGWLLRGPLGVARALEFVMDMCDGLVHAKQRIPGIVHRDLKPENTLIGRGVIAKITDFGLAKITSEAQLAVSPGTSVPASSAGLTRAGLLVGTAPYAAPEQWRGEDLDERTDIYALGCMLFEMLTGQLPFRDLSYEALRAQHLDAPVPQLPPAAHLPVALDRVVTRCLAKRPEERFLRVEDLREELSSFYQQHLARPPRTPAVASGFAAADYTNRAGAYADLRQWQEALSDCTRAIELDPNDARAYAFRGDIYHMLDRHEEALADCITAIHLQPEDALAYSYRGCVLSSLRRHEDALADFQRAIERDPGLLDAYLGRALALADVGRSEEALRDYDRGVQTGQANVRLWYNRGKLLSDLGREQEAIASYREALRLDPLDTES